MSPSGPQETPQDKVAFAGWIDLMLDAGADLVVTDVTHDEVHRELCRMKAGNRARKLAEFCGGLTSAPVTRAAWIKAGEFWGWVRNQGRPTAPDLALDGDAILAAVAATIGRPGDRVVIATSNVKDLKRFPGTDARRWQDIHSQDVTKHLAGTP